MKCGEVSLQIEFYYVAAKNHNLFVIRNENEIEIQGKMWSQAIST